MSAADLAAVVVAMLSLVAVGVLVAVAMSLQRTVRDIRTTLERLHEETVPAVETMAADLRRIDGLLERAEAVSARADALSKVTYEAVAKPAIKTAAVLRGTSRAGRRLRRREREAS